MIPSILIPLFKLVEKINQKFEELIIISFSRTKLLISNIMLKNKVFDREVGSDTLIVIQIFTVFLIFILISQFFL